MIGGLLASLSGDSQSSHAGSNSRPWLFATLNASTVLLLIGFGLGNMKVVGGAGIILIGAVASVAPAAWQYVRQHQTQPTAPPGYTVFHSSPYSLITSYCMAFQFIQPYYAHARLLIYT
jgi:hypothetical protein